MKTKPELLRLLVALINLISLRQSNGCKISATSEQVLERKLFRSQQPEQQQKCVYK